MTSAEKIVESNRVPDSWDAGSQEVTDLVKKAYSDLAHINSVIAEETPGDHTRNYAVEQDLFLNKVNNHGLHAYRYEVCDDESVVALYANDESATLKMKAFPDMATASAWTPRDEFVALKEAATTEEG